MFAYHPLRWHLLLIMCFFLSSCGGGGGGSNPVTSSSGNTVYDETVLDDLDYTQGTPSTSSLSDTASSLLVNDTSKSILRDNTAASLPITIAHSLYNAGFEYPIATRDTNASQAWQDGWTGLGQIIGFLDEFDEGDAVGLVNSDDNTNDSHGEKVSFIANSVAPEAELIWYNVVGQTDTNQSQAAIIEDRFNLTEDDSIELENSGALIINNSWNTLRKDITSDSTWENEIAILQNLLANQNHSYSDEMLFVYSAGNLIPGKPCPSKKLEECDVTAATILENRNMGIDDNRVRMWVGSVDSNNVIASYSIEAGEMANDFLTAHDDLLSSGDGEGTSYAAPRVSGAAALLNQKFPNLKGNDIKDVLLQTADDLGATGVDDIYGYGLLNINNAKSPVGTLSP
jgi:subtilisin family serine protease